MKYLIAGLGNVGGQYELTRHNIGFLILDRLADEHDAKFELKRHALVAHYSFKGRQIYLIKPTTYMNLSGQAVRHWLQELKIEKENLLVVTDDIALPYAKVRIRAKGSAGGHNGLKNIEELLMTQEYARMRFGVGSDFAKGRQADYVLSPFKPQEMEDLVVHLDHCSKAIDSFCTVGLEPTMTNFNTK